MRSAPRTKSRSHLVRWIVYLAMLGLLAIVITSQRETFGTSLRLLKTVNVAWILAGTAVFMTSTLFAASMYLTLSPRPLRFTPTWLVQLANLCINRLLPAGSGALGSNYLYLRGQKLSRIQAGSVITVNNLLGLSGHLLLLGLAVAFWPHALRSFSGISVLSVVAGASIVFGIVAVAFMLLRSSGQRAHKLFREVRPIFSNRTTLLRAQLYSMVITLIYTAALAVASAAFGYHESLAKLLIVLSFSVAASSAIPVPGGIGAAEAGIYAGYYSFGLPGSDALSVAILFRIITFWIPLVFGAVALAFVSRLRLLEAKP